MSDGIVSTSILKALDELSQKVYIPATIVCLYIDANAWFKAETGFESFWALYICCFIFGGILSFLIIAVIIITQHYLTSSQYFSDIELQKIIGIFILPFGLVGIFPEYFHLTNYVIPTATGITCTIWGFLLLGKKLA